MNVIERYEAERQRVLQSDSRAMTNGRIKRIDDIINSFKLRTLPHGPSSVATSEADTQQRIRASAYEHGLSIWRNNSGAMQDDTGRVIRFGLGNDSPKINKVWKSSDLIGIFPHGLFLAVECKHPKWTKPANDRDRAQWNFILHVVERGGVAFFCNGVDDFERRMAEYGLRKITA